ncbi:tetratricopeptide repeat protein [Niveispirillum cyanobacteriorum]|nr:SEL1-like repeat protein [Niveispirillum cyanobacteriorum]
MTSSPVSPRLWHRLFNRLFGTPHQRGYRAAARAKLTKAVAIWHEAAQTGDGDCQLALAEALWHGQGTLPDPGAALRWYEQAALAGRPLAQARLAAAYAMGVPETHTRQGKPSYAFTRDRSKARHWAKIAAEQGYVDAQVLLAWLLSREEENAARDVAGAIDWYGRALDQGSAAAMIGLAGLISAGEVPDQGPEDAFQLYRKAADQGYKTAFYHLGVCLLQGTGVVADPKEAQRWLRRAADGGITGAIRVLGLIHLRGLAGEPVDMGQAETWLRRAAVKGDTESMVLLADLHATGKAKIANQAEAILWYVTASDAGYARATTALGKAHLTGQGVLIDHDRAIALFERVADEDPEARFQLGLCHLLGKGTPVNQAVAAQHLLKASEQQHPDAAYNYGALLHNGIGVPQDRQGALNFYNAAAELGSASGQYRMAYAYALGQEVPEDPDRAIELFTAAAEQEHHIAQVNLVRMLLKHYPDDRAALEKWRERIRISRHINSPETATILAELAWRLDQDAKAALALLREFVPANDLMGQYVREMITRSC